MRNRPLIEKVPVRLSRSISVLDLADVPLPEGPLLEDPRPVAAAQTAMDPIYTDPLETVCFPMVVFAASLLTLLFLLLLSSTAALVLFVRQRGYYKDTKSWYDQ